MLITRVAPLCYLTSTGFLFSYVLDFLFFPIRRSINDVFLPVPPELAEESVICRVLNPAIVGCGGIRDVILFVIAYFIWNS